MKLLIMTKGKLRPGLCLFSWGRLTSGGMTFQEENGSSQYCVFQVLKGLTLMPCSRWWPPDKRQTCQRVRAAPHQGKPEVVTLPSRKFR